MIRWLLVFILLGGCASQPVVPRPSHVEDAVFAMNGRISVKYDGKRDSAGLRWTHQLQNDEILLLTPLGQTAARIYRDDHEATLDESNKHYQDKDVEALMMQVLGWRLQLDSLHRWVLGQPAASDALVEWDKLGRIAVQYQDGWEVRYLKYADDKADAMPARMQLSRPDLQLTLLIDGWEWNLK